MSLSKGMQFCCAVVALGFFAGCPAKEEETLKPYTESEKNTDTHGHDHDHAHEHGPHDGHVIELTKDGKFHGEVTYTAEGRKITIYILGADLETAVPVDLDAVTLDLEGAKEGEELELPLTPAPLEGEPEGKSSVFVVEGDKVPAEIDNIEKVHGHIHVTIDGTTYEGDISHDHDDHDHEHGDEKAKPAEEKPAAEPETGSAP